MEDKIESLIQSAMKNKGRQLSEEEKAQVEKTIMFWISYGIEDVISDAIEGITFETKIK